MQNGPHARHNVIEKAHRLTVDRVLVTFRPAIRPGDHLHAVGAERVQLAQLIANRHGFDVSVARDQQKPVPALKKINAGVIEARAADQIEKRMIFKLVAAFIQNERDRRRRFRPTLDQIAYLLQEPSDFVIRKPVTTSARAPSQLQFFNVGLNEQFIQKRPANCKLFW